MAMDPWPRHDIAAFYLTGGRVEVYRRADKLVQGPCISVHLDLEVLRIDLPVKPAGKAHEHWAGIPGRPRMYYPPDWPWEQHADLAVHNLVVHTVPACAVAGVTPPPKKELVAAARWARPLLDERRPHDG